MTEEKYSYDERERNPVPSPSPHDGPRNYVPPRPPRQPRSHSVFWPVVMIGAGLLFLLSNLGLFPRSGWAVLWRLWPLVLVGLGLDVMIGRRSTGGALASAVTFLLLLGLVLGIAIFAENIPFMVGWLKPADLKYEHVESDLSGLESADVFIDWTSAPGYLSVLDDSNNLIEADVAYRGTLRFDVDDRGDHADVVLESYLQGVSYGSFDFNDVDATWDVRLSPDVMLSLRLDAGSGRGDYDLSEMDIRRLVLDMGSGAADLHLPESNSFTAEIDGGSGALVITLPRETAMRVELDDGSGSFRPDKRFHLVSGDLDDDSVWETENYDKADDHITLILDQGSGDVTIR